MGADAVINGFDEVEEDVFCMRGSETVVLVADFGRLDGCLGRCFCATSEAGGAVSALLASIGPIAEMGRVREVSFSQGFRGEGIAETDRPMQKAKEGIFI